MCYNGGRGNLRLAGGQWIRLGRQSPVSRGGPFKKVMRTGRD